MSDNFGGDEPTRAYRPPQEPTGYPEPDATRLERRVPTYDENREPAYNPYPQPPAPDNRPGIAAQLVLVGLIGIIVGLVLGFFLFRGTDAGETSGTTTTTAAVSTTASSTTSSSTTTSTTEATTTTRRSTTTTSTTVRPTTSTTTANSTTTTN